VGAQRIRVVASRDRDRLHLMIHNTGSVLQPGWREGIGLANCRERLRVLHGDAATLDISGDGGTSDGGDGDGDGGAGAGVAASISLPLDTPSK